MSTTKITPIRKLPPDQSEALMRAEYVHALRKVRDEIKGLADAEYLYSPILPLEDVQRIQLHLRDARESMRVAVFYIRPKEQRT